jgi:hypothetical protein
MAERLEFSGIKTIGKESVRQRSSRTGAEPEGQEIFLDIEIISQPLAIMEHIGLD